MRQGNDTIEDLAPQVLVERIRDGSESAESELVRRYSRAIMVMLKQRTGDVQRAEDIHQDTFCVVLQRLRTTSIDDPSRISAFLHKTAINLLIGEFRKEARRRTHADTDLVQRHTDTRSNQLTQLIREEADKAIRTMIQEMRNARDRELLYRFYVLQQEKPLVCKALALTTEHFDRVISRARKRFRQLVEEKRFPVDSLDEYG